MEKCKECGVVLNGDVVIAELIGIADMAIIALRGAGHSGASTLIHNKLFDIVREYKLPQGEHLEAVYNGYFERFPITPF